MEVFMEDKEWLLSWVGHEVRVTLQGRISDRSGHPGPDFESIDGVLVEGNDIGAAIERSATEYLGDVVPEEPTPGILFIPWTAIREIELKS
jgi:hypothetical protein